jgi:hypothetical protein
MGGKIWETVMVMMYLLSSWEFRDTFPSQTRVMIQPHAYTSTCYVLRLPVTYY